MSDNSTAAANSAGEQDIMRNYNSSNAAFYLVAAVIQIVLFVIFSTWYISRRRNNPLSTRQPWLALTHFTGSSVVSVSLCIANAVGSNVKCLGMILALLAGSVTMCFAWSARITLLVISRITTQNKVQVASLASLKDIESWEKRSRRGWRISLGVGALLVIACLVGAGVWLVHGTVYDGTPVISQVLWIDVNACIPRFKKVETYIIFPMNLLCAVQSMLITFIWFKPNRKEDHFYLLGEMYMGVIFFSFWSMNLLVGQLSDTYISSLYGSTYDYGTLIFFIIPQLIEFLVILVNPIAKSYTTEFNPVKLMKFLEHSKLTNEKKKKNRVTRIQLTKDLVLEDFVDFLTDPEGFSCFLNFLIHEWSVENLICWRDCFRYKIGFGKANKFANVEEGLKIYKKYFVHKNPLIEVNVSGETFRNIQEFFSKLPDIDEISDEQRRLLEPVLTGREFDAAERELVRLMYGDTFQRYRLKHKEEFAKIRARLVFHTLTPSGSNVQEIVGQKLAE
eukprot:TRINITY_DN4384_c0_g2_i1.p1 TRINITY_DN4384_c0_g2~~TRINITY_DN4384_c0_g2_i1.p1  ORF type:complete len:506 (-),score=112.71 TRINITY_DN4384_c0_g2_i1:1073-2590(-)